MKPRTVWIAGIGFWADTVPDWPNAKEIFCGRAEPSAQPSKRPAPAGLAPAERRRAPDSVCVAMQAADEAVAASGLPADQMNCVFASSQGDLGLTDYMCDTLAADPSAVSPTKFHNSVHNAPVGYWSIAHSAQTNSTSVCAYDNSFAAGLLEALSLCADGQDPVLFCAYDIAATGSLAQVTHSERMLGVALVLVPSGPVSQGIQLQWSASAEHSATPIRTDLGRELAVNAMADALPFCEGLALLDHNPVILAAGPSFSLILELSPID